jgi:hypothetical protein
MMQLNTAIMVDATTSEGLELISADFAGSIKSQFILAQMNAAAVNNGV